jgi:hypothetical protein
MTTIFRFILFTFQPLSLWEERKRESLDYIEEKKKLSLIIFQRLKYVILVSMSSISSNECH